MFTLCRKTLRISAQFAVCKHCVILKDVNLNKYMIERIKLEIYVLQIYLNCK